MFQLGAAPSLGAPRAHAHVAGPRRPDDRRLLGGSPVGGQRPLLDAARADHAVLDHTPAVGAVRALARPARPRPTPPHVTGAASSRERRRRLSWPGRAGRRAGASDRGPMLEIRGLTKHYGQVTALDGASLTARRGRLLGFLGPNGAGKTTTMRCIFGLAVPESGEVRWDGQPVDAKARLRFGYMPEQRGLYPRMRVGEQLAYFAQHHGLSGREARARTGVWLERFGLADRAKSKLEDLSHGNQQRIQLATALVHDPELLVLDEPFSGLDPLGVADDDRDPPRARRRGRRRGLQLAPARPRRGRLRGRRDRQPRPRRRRRARSTPSRRHRAGATSRSRSPAAAGRGSTARTGSPWSSGTATG